MFQGFVVCIFSYNRGGFLQNLLSSLCEFYPEMQIAIFDDGSNEQQTVDILEQEKNKGSFIYSSSEDKGDSKHGGLYYLMNLAIRYACEHDFRYAYFVQDDMQFLWRDEHLEERVIKIFQKEECLMCNFSFLQKILTAGLEKRLPKIQADDSLYSFEGNGVADTGIIDLQKARQANLLFPESSEGGNGNYWYAKGYRLYWSPIPHLAWVPWPTTFRHKQKKSRRTCTLKPLSVAAVERIKENTGYTFLEDYTSTQHFILKPYWYADSPGFFNLIKIYTKYYLRIP